MKLRQSCCFHLFYNLIHFYGCNENVISNNWQVTNCYNNYLATKYHKIMKNHFKKKPTTSQFSPKWEWKFHSRMTFFRVIPKYNQISVTFIMCRYLWVNTKIRQCSLKIACLLGSAGCVLCKEVAECPLVGKQWKIKMCNTVEGCFSCLFVTFLFSH